MCEMQSKVASIRSQAQTLTKAGPSASISKGCEDDHAECGPDYLNYIRIRLIMIMPPRREAFSPKMRAS